MTKNKQDSSDTEVKNQKWREAKPPSWFKMDSYSYLSRLDAISWLKLIDERQEGRLQTLFGETEMFVPQINIPVCEVNSAEDLLRSTNPLHRHILNLSVDLRVHDALLLKEIQAIITKHREFIRRSNPGMPRGPKPELSVSAFTQSIFNTWRSNGIIPLRDLEIWANHNNTRFTDAQMGRWIFDKTLKPSRDINRARKVWKDAVISLPALRAHLQV